MGVETLHPVYRKYVPLWKKCSDVYEGEEAVQAAGPAYLPMLTDQTQEKYRAYSLRASLFNATRRTVVGMNGMIFRRPAFYDVPETLKARFTNVDGAGRSFETFQATVVTSVLIHGHCGVLVDYSMGFGAVSLKEAELTGSRPKMVYYAPMAITNWKNSIINNIKTLCMVVLKEAVIQETDDEFSPDRITQYRVLDLLNGFYRVRLFREMEDAVTREKKFLQYGPEVFPLKDGFPLSFIPFLFIGARNLTTDLDNPPLLDLVNLNLSHYRTTADLEHGAHFTALPTLVISGYDADATGSSLNVGSTKAWMFPDPATRAEYAEVKGPGMAVLERILERKEKQMAVVGSRMLEQASRNVDSAERASIHRKGEEGVLATLSQTISRGLEQVLTWFAWWDGIDGQIRFELNKDFYPVPISPDMLRELVGALQSGSISPETFFENMQKGEIVSDTVTFEEESSNLVKPLVVAPQTNASVTQKPTGGQNG